jgi:dihydrofolate synthase / folylpolyglutamate synthase
MQEKEPEAILNYNQAIRFLYSQLPMFQRVGPKAFKTNLDNITELANSLGNPEKNIRSIHIAGTNGKGSVAHILASILQSAGLKTGLYTSPHYLDFRERIRINGIPVSREFVCDFVNRVQELTLRLKPSFFEISVAMAFDYFSREYTDMAVIETGLGGRLDSTNIIDPELSVITNIGLDHTQFLGDTLKLIAVEKAGIIKPGKRVVIGKIQAETSGVFEEIASGKNAPLLFAENQLKTTIERKSIDSSRINVWGNGRLWLKDIEVNLIGGWQAENINTALAAVLQLRETGQSIEDHHISEGLRNVRKQTGFSGRMQVLQETPLVLVDSAHNAEGMELLKKELEAQDFNHLHVILGLVNDKQPTGLLSLLPENAAYYFSKAQIPRGMPAEELRKQALDFNLRGDTYKTIRSAFKAALNNADERDLILVCGSIFTVAEVLAEYHSGEGAN